jgi:hypothetical protein
LVKGLDLKAITVMVGWLSNTLVIFSYGAGKPILDSDSIWLKDSTYIGFSMSPFWRLASPSSCSPLYRFPSLLSSDPRLIDSPDFSLITSIFDSYKFEPLIASTSAEIGTYSRKECLFLAGLGTLTQHWKYLANLRLILLIKALIIVIVLRPKCPKI